MRPPGFFDLEDRFAKLDGLGDPLLKIAQVVDWEGFRSVLNRAFAKARKSNAGRKEYDRVHVEDQLGRAGDGNRGIEGHREGEARARTVHRVARQGEELGLRCRRCDHPPLPPVGPASLQSR